ncbi:hypothetical protein Q5O89_05030 [Peribacillus frigoritolerans]|nr:hypothetical protein [Peribacillus frigoritolerans]
MSVSGTTLGKMMAESGGESLFDKFSEQKVHWAMMIVARNLRCWARASNRLYDWKKNGVISFENRNCMLWSHFWLLHS